MNIKTALLFASAIFLASPAMAADELKPFILAESTETSMTAAFQKLETKVTSAGFTVVGTFTPYKGVKTLIATSSELQALATKSKHGGFGAMVRASVTSVGAKVQTSYTNLNYTHAIYRMEGDMSGIAAKLEAALGKVKEFGPEEGLTAEDAREYHYKFGMPYFDDEVELAEYPSHQAALDAVEAGLAKKAGGVSKVYRIDLGGKEESVFGVGMTVDISSDKYIMNEIDFKETRSTPHLPYELMVVGNKVIALPAEFRIALSFPDLAMMGANSFMNIMDSPGDIKTALKAVAAGK